MSAKKANENIALVQTIKNKLYWWVAINGPYVECSGEPLPVTVQCVPTPQTLYGFPTEAEARNTVRYFGRASVAQVVRKMMELDGREDVVRIRPENPEEPSEQDATWYANSKS